MEGAKKYIDDVMNLLQSQSRVLQILKQHLPESASLRVYGGFLRDTVDTYWRGGSTSLACGRAPQQERRSGPPRVDLGFIPFSDIDVSTEYALSTEQIGKILRAFDAEPLINQQSLSLVHRPANVGYDNTPICINNAQVANPIVRYFNAAKMRVESNTGSFSIKISERVGNRLVAFEFSSMSYFTYIDFLCNTLMYDLRTCKLDSFQYKLREFIPRSESLDNILLMIRDKIAQPVPGYINQRIGERKKKIMARGYRIPDEMLWHIDVAVLSLLQGNTAVKLARRSARITSSSAVRADSD